MLTLTLNTSTSQGSIALGENGHLLGEIVWEKQSSHSEKIVTEVANLYATQKKDVSQTELVICGHGPGSFTGIRVGLSFVRTMVHGLSIPVIAVEDCWSTALNADTKSSIAVALDAQKNMFFFGRYKNENGTLITIAPAQLISLDQLQKEFPTPSHWITNVPDVFINARIEVSTTEPFPSAQKIYHEVIRNREQHPETNWEQLTPLYLRASAAEEVLLKSRK
jgi:tRNA threonylcarbamoyladenosine biosynthesis protein TsaB